MDLRLTYKEVYKEVSEYLGTGDNPVDRDLRKAEEVINKGYRRFLFPREENGERHYWQFLRKDASMVTTQDQWQYTLPADFEVMKEDFGFDTQTGYYTCRFISQRSLMQKRVLSESVSFPRYYSIVDQPYTKEQDRLKEVWFYETPSQQYVLHYAYYFLPPKLENDSDLFVGGPLYDEVILACCIAEAEVKHTKKMGAMNSHAEMLLQQAVNADQGNRPSGLGLNLDPGIQRNKWQRPLPWIPPEDVYPNSGA